MREAKLYEPVTIGAVLLLLLKLLIAAASLAGAYYRFASANVGGLGEVKAELIELKSEIEREHTIRDVTTKRIEGVEYTLNFEPSFEWSKAVDPTHRAQLNKLIQEGIEATAETHLKRKVTLQNPIKQSSQIELDPSQGSTWEIQVKQEVIIGRVLIVRNNGEQVVMPFRLVIAKTVEGRPIRPWWKIWKR